MAPDGESITHRMGFGRVLSAWGENGSVPGSLVYRLAWGHGLVLSIGNQNVNRVFSKDQRGN